VCREQVVMLAEQGINVVIVAVADETLERMLRILSLSLSLSLSLFLSLSLARAGTRSPLPLSSSHD
jgi:hypothetical protein